MDIFEEQGYARRMDFGSDFAYILEDSQIFSMTDYNLLQHQGYSCFVPCTKLLYNGNIQIYYKVKAMKPLSSVIGMMKKELLYELISSFFENIITINENSFFTHGNIRMDFDSVYVDPDRNQVYFVYLPIFSYIHSDMHQFEREMRSCMSDAVWNQVQILKDDEKQQLSDLLNSHLSVETVYQYMKCKGGDMWCLTGRTTPLEIQIEKDDFLIGKQRDICDGVIADNGMISRLHGKVKLLEDQIFISDLNSKNGTYVNDVRLQPYILYELHVGDVVRFANDEFELRKKNWRDEICIYHVS